MLKIDMLHSDKSFPYSIGFVRCIGGWKKDEWELNSTLLGWRLKNKNVNIIFLDDIDVEKNVINFMRKEKINNIL